MPMLPHVPVISDETLISWAARAARVQTGLSLPKLLQLLGLTEKGHRPMRQVVDDESVRHLGDALGGDYEHLARIAWMRGPDDMIIHHGQTFHKSHLHRGSTAFCPHCLIEDQTQKYDRAIWRLKAGHTCVRHKVPLIVKPSSNEHVVAFVPELAFPSDGELRRLAADLPLIEPTRFQTYIEHRLAGQRQCDVVDGMNLGAVMHCVEILARELTLKSGGAPDATMAELETARDASFDALARGERGLEKVFGRIMANSANRGRCHAASTALGRVYTRVRQGGEASALRAPMLAFLLDRIPYAAGDEVLGVTVSTRTRHSLRTLKFATDLTQGMVNVIAEWLKPLHPNENLPAHSMVFEAGAAEEVVRRITNSVRLEALCERIICDEATARAIISAGLVEQINRAEPSESVAPPPRVTLRSIDALMRSMSDVSTQLAHPKPDMTTMTLAAKRQRWPVDRVIRLALAGKIDLYHLIGREDFQSFLVDEIQVLRSIQMSPLAERMAKEKAADELLVDALSIEKLMRSADDSGTPFIRRVVPISGRQLHRHLVAKADFDRFAADHVSIRRLAADLGRSTRQVAADLQLRGISPIPCNLTAENQIYRRADL